MTAISLERWSHYQGSDRWRRKMLHLGWCDCPSVWPIFGGSASDGEGAGGYFCLIGINKVETIWIIGTCWILVVILQCNAGRSFITKVDTPHMHWRGPPLRVSPVWRVKNKCTIIKCPRFRKVKINETSECGTICSDQRFVALHFVTIAFVKLRQIGTVISHDMVDSIAWKILIWILCQDKHVQCTQRHTYKQQQKTQTHIY